MKVKDFAVAVNKSNASSSVTLAPPGMLNPRGRAATSPHVPQSPVEPKAAAPKLPSPSPTRAGPLKVPNEHEYRGRHGSIASVNTFSTGGADSIFRLLPREARPAIRRMMYIEPTARCTIQDLLSGIGKKAGLVCQCGGAECGGGLNTPPDAEDDFDEDCDDEGDSWLKSIVPCSNVPDGGAPTHVHSRVAIDEKSHKKRFGF